jgi:hypothetical protein
MDSINCDATVVKIEAAIREKTLDSFRSYSFQGVIVVTRR